ncbi:helix-hairpin-helix domain-containing protein [Candidatus Thiothrix sp. Deng01]|uniref:Helix-hairpin-helix domain-containing protein n=1 Tax=Candidatus Thiothrix phosphatis TaxID=3112415 RepID=A0ABU6CY65_9GAMM|nr:helix-hairpin-helix domain-containing protein [Candidatus Thiothrix sp. Deng01]MEB4591765.1 helix-hairpin-helix domain-containing protein [Candidatus Thiothrix sp. Deng01]
MEQDLTAVKYVGPATAKRLAERGVATIGQLAAMPVGELAEVPGIGAGTAPLILASAQAILNPPALEDGVEEMLSADVVDIFAEDVEDTADQEAPVADMIEDDAGGLVSQEVLEAVIVAVAASPHAAKNTKKRAKKAKKAAKKAAKKTKKLEKETKKAIRKAEKKANKKAKKAAKKAKKNQE